MAVSEARQAKQVRHLAQPHQQPRAGHKANDDRFGNVAREIAELTQGDHDLNHPHEHGEKEHRLRLLGGVERTETRDGTEDDE